MATDQRSSSRLLVMGALVFAIGVILVLLVLQSGNDEASPAPAGDAPPVTTTDPSTAPTSPPVVTDAQDFATFRLPFPLEVPDGFEAVAIRTDFVRGVAALPTPGDLVNLYRLPASDAAIRGDGVDDATDETRYADANPDAELLAAAVEVLAITGPLPSAADGSPVVIVAVPSADVPHVLPVAAAGEVWMTLLPRPDEEATS